jgi:hypothetical protein
VLVAGLCRSCSQKKPEPVLKLPKPVAVVSAPKRKKVFRSKCYDASKRYVPEATHPHPHLMPASGEPGMRIRTIVDSLSTGED